MANVIDSRNDGTIYTKMPSGITYVFGAFSLDTLVLFQK